LLFKSLKIKKLYKT